MKYLFYCFLIWSVTITYCTETEPKVRKFVGVSTLTTAAFYYPRLRNTKLPHNEPNIDRATKKQICRDIFSSYEFSLSGKLPDEKSAEFSTISRFLGHEQENYVSKEIEVITLYETPEIFGTIHEHVFLCLVLHYGEGVEWYVSEEYNLNGDQTNSSSNDYIAGRFIFSVPSLSLEETKITLFGLAEDTATAVSGPEIEYLYLDRRKKYLPQRSRKEDPLCKLNSEEKLRICVVVFNSTYFEAVEFPHSTVGEVEGTCKRKTVYFRTERGKSEATEREFVEWMMSCESSDIKEGFPYFLSQAYRSNEIFVYSRENDTQQMFLDNLSTNVRLTVNGNRFWNPDDSDGRNFDDTSDYLVYI